MAEGLRSAGCTTIEDVATQRIGDIAGSAEHCAQGLRAELHKQQPDLLHAIGPVAGLAALQVRPPGMPVVVTFDESSPDRGLEEEIAREADAVLALSTTERERWERAGVHTLSQGVPALPLPVRDHQATAASGGDVVTLSAGPELDVLIAAMTRIPGQRVVVLARMGTRRLAAVRELAQRLGVADRLTIHPGVYGRERRAAWAQASVIFAGCDGARHGGQVLEAAAHGVPAVACAQGAHLDHVVAGVTGVLVEPDVSPLTLARAMQPLLSDPLLGRGLGAAALVRVEALHDPATSGARVKSLYEQLLANPVADPAGTSLTSRLSPERAALAVEYLPLARQLAGWYTGRGQSTEDLVQVASLGLVRAAERFNPDFGREFHSFAMPTILGELRRHFRDQAWAVRVPRGLQENTLAVQRASEELRQELGHDATTADLAQELGLVEEEIRAAQQAHGEARTSRSLDHPTGEDESRTFGDLVGGPDPGLEFVEQSHDVRVALAKMPPRELEIVLMRFYGDCTQSEIAERLGMSQVHVSRVLTRTLAAVRDHVLYDIPLPRSWERERSAATVAAQPAQREKVGVGAG